MNRSQSLSIPAGLTEDILAVAWSVFEYLPDTHPLRADFMSALWCLEDAIDSADHIARVQNHVRGLPWREAAKMARRSGVPLIEAYADNDGQPVADPVDVALVAVIQFVGMVTQ